MGQQSAGEPEVSFQQQGKDTEEGDIIHTLSRTREHKMTAQPDHVGKAAGPNSETGQYEDEERELLFLPLMEASSDKGNSGQSG